MVLLGSTMAEIAEMEVPSAAVRDCFTLGAQLARTISPHASRHWTSTPGWWHSRRRLRPAQKGRSRGVHRVEWLGTGNGAGHRCGRGEFTSMGLTTFQDIILALSRYWADQGCVVLQPYDMEVGAGTFHPATTLRSLGPERGVRPTYSPAGPTDGRYGENPNRLQHYYQYQVLLKPSPDDVLDLYFDRCRHRHRARRARHRLVEDDWESPTLGAWGLGWEVWLNGMECTQFTYFQQVGGIECAPCRPSHLRSRAARDVHPGRGLRLRPLWSRRPDGTVHLRRRLPAQRAQYSAYNFEIAHVDMLLSCSRLRGRVRRTLEAGSVLPAYDQALKCSHVFNLLDARGAISVTERQGYILRVRALAKACCAAYLELVTEAPSRLSKVRHPREVSAHERP